jgi:glutaminase
MRDSVDEEAALRTISTGRLPSSDRIEHYLEEAYRRFGSHTEGIVADYIPVLANADPEAFALCSAEVDGSIHVRGDVNLQFSIQSISKAFVYALVCHDVGHEIVLDRVGVNNTGLAFNSVVAVELNNGSPMNPMVNAGPLATTSLIPGETATAKWNYIVPGLSAFAGRPLKMDTVVYDSEAASNQRNVSIASLLHSYGRLEFAPEEITDIYTRQCSLSIGDGRARCRHRSLPLRARCTSHVGPLSTLRRVALQHRYARQEWGFRWNRNQSPRKGGLATYSAPLDPAGNSVRGQRATHYLSGALGLNLFASKPAAS